MNADNLRLERSVWSISGKESPFNWVYAPITLLQHTNLYTSNHHHPNHWQKMLFDYAVTAMGCMQS